MQGRELLLAPLLWPAVGGLLVSGAALVWKRNAVAKALATWSVALSALGAIVCCAAVVLLAVAPSRFFGGGLTPESVHAMRAIALPNWFSQALLGGACTAASLAVRSVAKTRLLAQPRSKSVVPALVAAGLLLSANVWVVWIVVPQVQATARVRHVSDLLATYAKFHQPLPETLVLPDFPNPVLDDWGNALGYLVTHRCFAVISYGSDGRPDTAYGSEICEQESRTRGTCFSPSRDTIFVNGRPSQSCAY